MAASGSASGIDPFGLASRLEQHALIRPGDIAISDPSRALTYGQLHRATHDLATDLRRGGLRPADSVAILMTNRVEWLLYLFATWAAGGVAVPINFSTPDEIDVVLRDVGAGWVVTEPSLMRLIERTAPRRRVLHAFGPPEAAETAQIGPEPSHIRRYEDVALIHYTSGTVGHPNAIQHSHASMS